VIWEVADSLEAAALAYGGVGKRDSAIVTYAASRRWRSRDLSPHVRRLLASNILLEPASAEKERAFLEEARQLLDSIPPRVLGELPATARQAVDYLEIMLASERVSVMVTSSPPGLKVLYWPLVRDSSSARDVTTGDTIRLRPAAYVFKVRDPKTGSGDSTRRDCLIGCQVHFTFPR
jgi:hypothetical protein